jgi:hypothetical protein
MTQKEMAMPSGETFAKGRSSAFRRPRDAKDNPDWDGHPWQPTAWSAVGFSRRDRAGISFTPPLDL